MIQISKIEGFYNIQDNYYMFKRMNKVYFKNKNTKKFIKPFMKKGKSNGYMYIKLPTKDSDTKNIRIHRLIAAVYIENENDLEEVHHKDDDRKNNSIDNLEWVTRQENMSYRWKNKSEMAAV